MFDRQPIGDDFTWMHSGQLGATKINTSNGAPNGQLLSKQKITVSGSDDPLLNGSYRVISLTTDTVTLKISGVTNTAGIVKTKVSPLGFESVIGNSKPLIRGYRSKDPTSTKTVLHLDMSYSAGAGYAATNPAKRAMVTACADVDASGKPVGDYFASVNNRASTSNGSLFWYESRYQRKDVGVSSDSTPLSWVIIGNGKYFYLFNSWYPYVDSTDMRDFYAFGDMASFSDSDIQNCILKSAENYNDDTTIYYTKNGAAISNYSSGVLKTGYFIGTHSGVSSPVPTTISYGNISQDVIYSGYSSVGNYSKINAVTNSMLLCPAYLYTAAGARARMPRLMILPFTIDARAVDLSIMDDMLFITVSASSGTGTADKNRGAFAFDMRD